ncbi:MAG: hypothetical protein QXE23_07760 [Nitrososphaerota archaeon]
MMVTIEEVEYVLSRTLLPPPKHVFISDKPVRVEERGEGFWVMGFQRRGSDMIVLTPYSTPENIVHETIHAMGFGEIAAQIGGKLISLRIQLLPNLFRRSVKYRQAGEKPPEALGLEEAGRYYLLREGGEKFQIKHFVLEAV